MFVSTAKKSSPDVPPSTSTLNVPRSADVSPVSSSVLPSGTPRSAEDPYEVWLAEQKTREKEWANNRATKRAKVVEKELVRKSRESSESISCQKDKLSSVRKQLEAKTEECTLESELRELQHTNADAMKNMQESQKKFYKVSLQHSMLCIN